MGVGVNDDGIRDRNFGHWFITNESNKELIKKNANLGSKRSSQMIHNHSYEESCTPFSKCYAIEYRIG